MAPSARSSMFTPLSHALSFPLRGIPLPHRAIRSTARPCLRARQLIAVVSIVSSLSIVSTAQTKAYVHHPERDPSTPQSVEGGIWRLDRNFESTLHLKNVLLNQALEAKPSLIMADGTSYSLPVVKLEPAGVASVNISDAVRHMPASMAPHQSLYGMVSIDYSWSWAGAVIASVQNIDEIAMLSVHSAVQADKARLDVASQQSAPQRLDAIWWRPYSSTEMYLFIGNSSDTPKPVSLHLRTESASLLYDITIDVAPHASTKVNVFSLFNKSPNVGSTGSLSIEYYL